MIQSYKVIFNPQVYDDIKDSLAHYRKETKSEILGQRFLKAVKTNIKKLNKNPLNYQIRYRDIRFLEIVPFPHLAHFRVDEEKRIVKVEAIIHPAQDPNKWHSKTSL